MMPSRLQHLMVAALAAVFLSTCGERARPQNAAALSDALPTIVGMKNEAEQWARRVRGNYAKGTPQHETAYTKYISAKAAFDTWLDRFALDLTLGTDITSSSSYQSALRDAATKGDDFIRYSKGLYEHSLSGPSPVSWLSPLTDAALKIWENHRTASKAAQAETAKTLQTLKWKPFEEV
jgi:hypothetical protein